MFNVNNKNTRTMSQTLKNEKKETSKQGKILNPTYQVVLHYFFAKSL